MGEAGPWNGGDTTPGVATPLFEHYNGSVWSPLPPSGGDGSLYGVATVASDDAWAVGYSGQSFSAGAMLIEHWDGHLWAPIPLTNKGALFAVAAADSKDAWAVGGSYGRRVETGVILHWDGVGWRQVVRTTHFLNDVSVVSNSDVWVVGDQIAMHWDGRHWRTVAIPRRVGKSITPPNLERVTAVSPRSVWAVGSAGVYQPHEQQPVVIEWNGRKWIDHSPMTGDLQGAALEDIVVSSPGGTIWLASTDWNDWISLDGGSLSASNGRNWTVHALPHRQEIAALTADSNGTIWGVGSSTIGMSPDPQGAFDHTVPLIMRNGC